MVCALHVGAGAQPELHADEGQGAERGLHLQVGQRWGLCVRLVWILLALSTAQGTERGLHLQVGGFVFLSCAPSVDAHLRCQQLEEPSEDGIYRWGSLLDFAAMMLANNSAVVL